MTQLLAIMLLVFGMPLVVAAEKAMSLGAGTWKLNVERSKFQPGPGPKVGTVMVSPEGKIDYTAELADGQIVHWSVVPSEGKAVPITGMESSTLTETRIDDKTFDHVWNFADRTATARGVVSNNGKTLTYTFSSKAPDGQIENNIEVFEKQ